MNDRETAIGDVYYGTAALLCACVLVVRELWFSDLSIWWTIIPLACVGTYITVRGACQL